MSQFIVTGLPVANPHPWAVFQGVYVSLRYLLQLSQHSTNPCWLFLANLILREHLPKCVQGQREMVKLQSILLNFFVMMVEKLRGNMMLLAKMQLYIHDCSIHLCPI